MMSKRVAVIGAGASGLTAIKSCQDEGLIPVCYERTDAIGGLWNFTAEARECQVTPTSEDTKFQVVFRMIQSHFITAASEGWGR